MCAPQTKTYDLRYTSKNRTLPVELVNSCAKRGNATRFGPLQRRALGKIAAALTLVRLEIPLILCPGSVFLLGQVCLVTS